MPHPSECRRPRLNSSILNEQALGFGPLADNKMTPATVSMVAAGHR